MKIYLIRHGETTGDIEDRYGGLYEDHLTKNGIIQAEELASKLEDKEIQKVFVSPRVRAIETSLIVAKKVPAKFITVNELSERNSYGILTGLTKTEAKEKFSEEVEDLEANNPYHKIKDSEEYYDFAEKVIAKFTEITEKELLAETDAIAMITHGGVITTIFREVLGFEIRGIKDCAIFELDFDGAGYEIIYAKDLEKIWSDA